MIEPLRLSFDVACAADHAFAVWTGRIGTWWPPDHTVSGAAAQIVLERAVGGRIFERTADGVEYDWGEVTVWQPPTTLAYLWHIGRDRSQATEVEIQFVPAGEDATRIEIEQRGWEQAGVDAVEYRRRNVHGWTSLIPYFISAATEGASA